MNELKRNGSGYYDATMYQAMKNIIGGENMEVYRGDIFYIKSGGKVTGSEQRAERPAVIVSNNTGNHFSNIVEVVFLTSKKKNHLPTHAEVMCQVPSTALCEQVCNMSKDRLGEFIRQCTDEEMEAIDRRLMIALHLDHYFSGLKNHEEAEEVEKLKAKNEELLNKIDRVNSAFAKCVQENEEIKKNKNEVEQLIVLLQDNLKNEKSEYKATIVLKTERDTYKRMYEQTIDKLIAG